MFMASVVTESLVNTLFYFAIFFLVMSFIFAHLSFPFKMIGNILKHPTYVERTDLTTTFRTINEWGVIAFLDGALMVITLVILVFLRLTWKKCSRR